MNNPEQAVIVLVADADQRFTETDIFIHTERHLILEFTGKPPSPGEKLQFWQFALTVIARQRRLIKKSEPELNDRDHHQYQCQK